MWHILLHSAKETLMLLPFLFLSYLLMEFLEHKSGNAAEKLLKGSGRIGPVIGSVFSVIPQCGFSVAATGLYTGRVITVGTLIAVYLSTSDEMLPILVSEGIGLPFILKILATKLIIGICAGFIIDLIFSLIRKRKNRVQKPQIEELCEREHCHCHHNIALSALKHTAQVALFVFLFTFLLHGAIELIGENNLKSLAVSNSLLGNLMTALLGLVPNCASSVIITELYIEGVISVGSMLSGLLVNSGVALAVLFKNNRPISDSFRILAILFLVSLALGTLIDLTPIAKILSL